ncbi:hypothetical protein EYF80_044918 [Liparis tanakae]|uniref:Uncharacterized protein n=1 Tax=Liparis tanakae TaxID=230148 RepID=A0A4Z2FUF8_9TELE|nr:hypothetical protein EYF80_044918 [Liparis tanakae]
MDLWSDEARGLRKEKLVGLKAPIPDHTRTAMPPKGSVGLLLTARLDCGSMFTAATLKDIFECCIPACLETHYCTTSRNK